MGFSDDFTGLLSAGNAFKFLATMNEHGLPNVVPVLSLEPLDENRAVFGEFMMLKTKRNLLQVPRAGVLAVGANLEFASATCDFAGFERRGPLVDKTNEHAPPFAERPGKGARYAGLLSMHEEGPSGWMRSRLLKYASLGLAFTIARGKKTAMPLAAFEAMNQRKAVKVLASIGPGDYPRVFPAMPMFAPDRRTLLLSTRFFPAPLYDRQRVAVCVLTQNRVAYQIKGICRQLGRLRAMVEVEEVFTACPPLCGEKIAG